MTVNVAPVDLLFATRGAGSALIEIAYALAHEPLRIEDLDSMRAGPQQERLRALNPLGQVPTLVLGDGRTMTESAAILLLLSERRPDAQLAPPPGTAARAPFLRGLMFLVAAIYPTFTFGDEPQKFVGEGEAARALRASTDRRREEAWRQFEAMFPCAPWTLGGTQPSLLDIYVTVMSRWRPRRAWFAGHRPKLHAVALRMEALPESAPVVRRNFGD